MKSRVEPTLMLAALMLGLLLIYLMLTSCSHPLRFTPDCPDAPKGVICK